MPRPSAILSKPLPEPSITDSLPWHRSLYIKNLPTKIKKPDVRMALYLLCATHGPVLDVVSLRTARMRGQAHVVFRDAPGAAQARRALQGFDFFGRELVRPPPNPFPSPASPGREMEALTARQDIAYGRGRSRVFTKLEGVYKPPAAPAPENAAPSLFTAPLPSAGAAPAAATPAEAATNGATGDAEPHGVKRGRDEASSDEGDAPMEEDDEDVPMEASSEED